MALSKSEAKDYWQTRLKYGGWLAALSALHWCVAGTFIFCAVLVWRRADQRPLVFALVGLWALCDWIVGHYFPGDEPRSRLGRSIVGPLKFGSCKERKAGTWNLVLVLSWVVALVSGGIPANWAPLNFASLIIPVAAVSVLIYVLSRD